MCLCVVDPESNLFKHLSSHQAKASLNACFQSAACKSLDLAFAPEKMKKSISEVELKTLLFTLHTLHVAFKATAAAFF